MWLAVLKPAITYKYVVCEGGYAPIAKIRYKMPMNERGHVWCNLVRCNCSKCLGLLSGQTFITKTLNLVIAKQIQGYTLEFLHAHVFDAR